MYRVPKRAPHGRVHRSKLVAALLVAVAVLTGTVSDSIAAGHELTGTLETADGKTIQLAAKSGKDGTIKIRRWDGTKLDLTPAQRRELHERTLLKGMRRFHDRNSAEYEKLIAKNDTSASTLDAFEEKSKAYFEEREPHRQSGQGLKKYQDGHSRKEVTDGLFSAMKGLDKKQRANVLSNLAPGGLAGTDKSPSHTESRILTALKQREFEGKFDDKAGVTSQERRRDPAKHGPSIFSNGTLRLDGGLTPCFGCDRDLQKLSRNYGTTVEYEYGDVCRKSACMDKLPAPKDWEDKSKRQIPWRQGNTVRIEPIKDGKNGPPYAVRWSVVSTEKDENGNVKKATTVDSVEFDEKGQRRPSSSPSGASPDTSPSSSDRPTDPNGSKPVPSGTTPSQPGPSQPKPSQPAAAQPPRPNDGPSPQSSSPQSSPDEEDKRKRPASPDQDKRRTRRKFK